MNKYQPLLEFCSTPRQTEFVNALIAINNVKKSGRSIGMSERAAYKMLSTIRKRMAAVGKGDHYIASNHIPEGFAVKGTSTLYKDGEASIQWVKTDRAILSQIESIENVISEIAQNIKPLDPIELKEQTEIDAITLFVSNDLHFGALMSKEYNHDRDWDLKIASKTVCDAIDYLIARSPASSEAVIADLGDLMEMDDYSNSTSRSGNILDVDGRWDKALDMAIMAMKYFVQRALEKYEKVYFYNIDGNHDDTSGAAVRYSIREAFANNPRAIINCDRRNIKYHISGNVALPFAHGHELKMGGRAESCFISDLRAMKVLDTIDNIYGHFGHTHKDAVYDGANTKQESHRNLPPSNVWATNMGYRRQAGTMKSITYDKKYGEVSRQTYNVMMSER